MQKIKATINDLLAELKALRGSIDALRNEQRAVEVSNEITAREALKIMRCNTNASLSTLVKLFPSIKIRRGIYDRVNLKAALKAKAQLKQR